MGVSYVRQELKAKLKEYTLVRDCLAGETAVKAKGSTYLPSPISSGDTDADSKRQKDYAERAVFYNVTRRTVAGLVGVVFERDPIIKKPDKFDPIFDDATGGGLTLLQLAKLGLREIVGIGRGGLLTDFPETPVGGISRKDAEEGTYRPMILLYKSEQIINWRTVIIGGKELLSLVVLEEEHVKTDDGFECEKEKRWRVLRLIGEGENRTYMMQMYHAADQTLPTSSVTPLDSKGQPFKEIPFMFLGVDSNSPEIDEPPVYDIASLNIAHYRNSADYEEACFITGQPTPVLAGLTEDWVKNVLKGKVTLGSRGAVALPEGGTAELLQALPNTMPFEAMQHKEKQMVSLGAKLVTPKEVERTATEVALDDAAQTSILSSAAGNVSAGITQSMKWCAAFTGDNPDEMEFILNKEFELTKLKPEEITAIIAAWQGDALLTEEMRDILRRGGLATKDQEEYDAGITDQQQQRLDLKGEEAETLSNATVPATLAAEEAKAKNKPKPKPKPKGK